MTDVKGMTEAELAAFIASDPEERWPCEGEPWHDPSSCQYCVAESRLRKLVHERESKLPGNNPFITGHSYFSTTVDDVKVGDILTFSLPGTQDWCSYYVVVEDKIKAFAGNVILRVRKTNSNEPIMRFTYEAGDSLHVSRMGYRT